jgi:hypothetical protein
MKYLFSTLILAIFFIPTQYALASLYESLNFNYENQQAGVFSLLLNLFISQSNAQTPDITTGLVGHWKFDETSGTTANDSAGSNTGTLTNGPVWTTGKLGGALSFDDINDSVNIGSATELDNIFASGGTFSAWINTNSAGAVFNKVKTGLRIGGYPKKLTFNQEFEPIDGIWTANTTLSDNTWYHIAVIYNRDNSSNKPIIYINSTLQALTETTPSGTPQVVTTSDLCIGNSSNASGGCGIGDTFSGLIDDIRIYNRTLTQADITELYNYTGAPTYQCNDGLDNDSDTFFDYPNDPGCTSATDDDEYNAPPQTCASFTYSTWQPTTCPANQTQTRTVTSSSPSGCTGGTPVTTQSCAYIPPTTNNTYYVATTGNDTNPGTQSQPWRTIQHAADTAQAGDTVIVKAGTYNELIESTHFCTLLII